MSSRKKSQKQVDRREFLRTAALATGGVFLAACGASPAATTAPTSAPAAAAATQAPAAVASTAAPAAAAARAPRRGRTQPYRLSPGSAPSPSGTSQAPVARLPDPET